MTTELPKNIQLASSFQQDLKFLKWDRKVLFLKHFF
jgi:hypothetical protein